MCMLSACTSNALHRSQPNYDYYLLCESRTDASGTKDHKSVCIEQTACTRILFFYQPHTGSRKDIDKLTIHDKTSLPFLQGAVITSAKVAQVQKYKTLTSLCAFTSLFGGADMCRRSAEPTPTPVSVVCEEQVGSAGQPRLHTNRRIGSP